MILKCYNNGCDGKYVLPVKDERITPMVVKIVLMEKTGLKNIVICVGNY